MGCLDRGDILLLHDRRSRKGRNLAEQPAIAVHLESGDDVVILEGAADRVCKYAMRVGAIPGDTGAFAVSPRTVFAWREKDFPVSATRWLFP